MKFENFFDESGKKNRREQQENFEKKSKCEIELFIILYFYFL